MTLPLVPAAPATGFVTVITSAMINGWRAGMAAAVDGTGGTPPGFPYTPSDQIGIAGAGLLLIGTTALELSATSIATQDVGGAFNFNGTLNVDGTGGSGALVVKGGGSIEVSSGTILLDASTAIIMAPLSFVDVGGTLGNPASIFVQNHGQIQVQSGGVIDLLTGGGITVQTGAVVEAKSGGQILIDAGATINNNGTENIKSGALLEVKSGGTFQTDAGSTFTQQGVRTKSGASGYDVGRVLSLNSGNATIASPWSYDTIWVGMNGVDLNGTTYTLAAPTGIPDGVRVRIVAPRWLATNSNTWTVAGLNAGGAAGSLTYAFNTAGGGAGVYITSNFLDVEVLSAKWQVCGQWQGG